MTLTDDSPELANHLEAFRRTTDSTILQRVCGTTVHAALKCITCDTETRVRTEVTPVVHLPLIALDRTLQIEDILTAFAHIDLNNARCPTCAITTDSLYRYQATIAHTSPLLFFTLERFKYGAQGTRDNTVVRFSEKLLIHTPSGFASKPLTKMYELMCVIEHHTGASSTKSGHYLCFTRDLRPPEYRPGTEWLCYDDSTVSRVTLETVLAREAYMLIYQRK